MMRDGTDPRTNIAVALALTGVAAAALWETRKIPPGSFEPLGSAPIPQVTAGLVILLCLWVIGTAWRRMGQGSRLVDEVPPRRVDTILVLLATVAYVAAMHAKLTDFAIMTTIFLVLTIGLLVRFERRRWPVVVLVAAVMGYGCQYLFTRIFVIDLPGL